MRHLLNQDAYLYINFMILIVIKLMVSFSYDFWCKATYDVKILLCSDYRSFWLKEGFTKE